MTKLLVRLFVKDRNNTSSPSVRKKYGTLSSMVGICVNVFLSAFKFIVGSLCGSIAITADATNNLSDAGSSIISFISFKLSAKPADREHPYGHARIEYIASFIVSILIIMVGFELIGESWNKIRTSEIITENGFSREIIIAIIVLCTSILLKLWLAFFYRKIGTTISSSVIKATSVDSISDVISTFSILISTLLVGFFGVNIDGYMGLAVAIFIIISGVKILGETEKNLLGNGPVDDIIDSMKKIINEYPEVLGIHDIMVHNYGPGHTITSLHVEVDGSVNIFETHDVIDNIEKRIASELNIVCTIHMDPIVTDDEERNRMHSVVCSIVTAVDQSLKIHDFRMVKGTTHTNLIFDVSAPFEYKASDKEIIKNISESVSKYDPNLFCVITVDRE